MRQTPKKYIKQPFYHRCFSLNKITLSIIKIYCVFCCIVKIKCINFDLSSLYETIDPLYQDLEYIYLIRNRPATR